MLNLPYLNRAIQLLPVSQELPSIFEIVKDNLGEVFKDTPYTFTEDTEKATYATSSLSITARKPLVGNKGTALIIEASGHKLEVLTASTSDLISLHLNGVNMLSLGEPADWSELVKDLVEAPKSAKKIASNVAKSVATIVSKAGSQDSH